MIETVLALDPSVRSPGVAVFIGGILTASARIKVTPSALLLDRGERVDAVADIISAWCRERLPVGKPAVFVYEWPQIYRGAKSKGDPNDLIALAAVGAAVARDLRDRVRIVTPLPAEWTGQLPKVTKGDPWASPRGYRVASRLSPVERALVPKSHDAIDGVGLGLWVLGRYQPVRVYPGAT